jgi:hypothetical protein
MPSMETTQEEGTLISPPPITDVDTSLPQINIETSADRQDMAAAKILSGETTLKPSQNRDLVKVGLRGVASTPSADLVAPAGYFSCERVGVWSDGLPDHHAADGNND